MGAHIIDGKILAQKILDELQKNIKSSKKKPILATILVGNDMASSIYIANKQKKAAEVGITSQHYQLDESISENDLLKLIEKLNKQAIHGILVQLPLPKHINENNIIEAIDPKKDVDGFHPYNIGRLALKMPLLRPCTPRGVMTMLEMSGIDPKGKHAVIVGASNIVGRPMALELLLARATVTVCHSATADLAAEVARADIVVAAVGKPFFVKGEWIKPGAVVVDVGINRLETGKVVGDVDFEAAKARASWITPVPGGVGLMTVATLLQNTLDTANLNA